MLSSVRTVPPAPPAWHEIPAWTEHIIPSKPPGRGGNLNVFTILRVADLLEYCWLVVPSVEDPWSLVEDARIDCGGNIVAPNLETTRNFLESRSSLPLFLLNSNIEVSVTWKSQLLSVPDKCVLECRLSILAEYRTEAILHESQQSQSLGITGRLSHRLNRPLSVFTATRASLISGEGVVGYLVLVKATQKEREEGLSPAILIITPNGSIYRYFTVE